MEQASIDAGVRPGVSTDAQEEIRRLKRENQELRRANEILGRTRSFAGRSAFFAAELDRPSPR